MPDNRLPVRASLVLVAAAVLAAGCSTVELDPRYDPPPVRAPAPVPPASVPPIATPQPIPPAQPVPQPLPPIGSTAPVPTPPMQTPVDPTASPQAHLVTLTTRIDGSNALPPTRSNGVGQLDALYDSSTRLLRWKTSWSGLSGPITGVQFHGPADWGQNGPVVMVWPAPFGPSYEGRATLTTQQAIDLLDGRWYVNVFTAAYPSGEMRGQLRVVH